MKIRAPAKFVIFVMRGWKADKKLSSMKGVEPTRDYFQTKLKVAKKYKADKVAKEKQETSTLCIEDMPDDNFWDMLNGEANIMNVATEEDVASHFDNVILNPPFDPYVKPSEDDAMSFIESMMAESKTAFGVAPTPAKMMIAPLPDTVERLDPLLRLPAEKLDTLTPIHLETERYHGWQVGGETRIEGGGDLRGTVGTPK